ncbi:hypothetical protein [Photobacterium kishitanii]|nr:hypothetical protein [Photobacterium kishitanii]
MNTLRDASEKLSSKYEFVEQWELNSAFTEVWTTFVYNQTKKGIAYANWADSHNDMLTHLPENPIGCVKTWFFREFKNSRNLEQSVLALCSIIHKDDTPRECIADAIIKDGYFFECYQITKKKYSTKAFESLDDNFSDIMTENSFILF